ncbi:MAG: MerR family transcriptional regulator [Xanthomonadales bacterium]|nr:MerR family transcriptional regulator [Xanthomonadales bacterium]
MYKIKAFSVMVGTSVKTLRHYEKKALLKPEYIDKTNGYRYYGDKSLATMQQILFYKEMDFPLNEIKDLINGEVFNQHDALNMQKNLLCLKKQRLDRMIDFIDDLLTNDKGISDMKKLKEATDNSVFEQKKIEYANEAKKRWGESKLYQQSQQKQAKYSQKDMKEINAKQNKIYQELASLMPLGIGHSEVQNKIDEARSFITSHWYDCSKKQFAALGEMYVTDQRFKQYLDQFGAGLADFIHQAIEIYVDCE